MAVRPTVVAAVRLPPVVATPHQPVAAAVVHPRPAAEMAAAPAAELPMAVRLRQAAAEMRPRPVEVPVIPVVRVQGVQARAVPPGAAPAAEGREEAAGMAAAQARRIPPPSILA